MLDEWGKIHSSNTHIRYSTLTIRISIIGEATKRLSLSFREQHSEIPWREIAGMHDVIVHEYDQIDLDVVWDVIQHKL